MLPLPLVDNNGSADIFVRNWLSVSPVNTLISKSVSGQPASGHSNRPFMSWDGTTVVFTSDAPDLVPLGQDSTMSGDLFRHDVPSGAIEMLSITSNGGQAQDPYSIVIEPGCVSVDGNYIVFGTQSPAFVPNDNNGVSDVFIRAAAGDPTHGAGFCFGDGSGKQCPCGNNGSAGNGCANSFFASGSNLSVANVSAGIASVNNDTITLIGQLVANSSCLFYQATAQLNNGNGFAFGDGLRCGGGVLVRLATRTGANNTVSFGHGIQGDAPVGVAGMIPAGGAVRHYQIWYRNADPLFCSGDTYNLTNGYTITWVP
jgi:hypothetical protein